ncbi:MAG: hypothetical protein EXR01_08845 [Acetobacteraceae bacterium]|nr:hypothetical protein [Acetobacteraceae bacterium]
MNDRLPPEIDMRPDGSFVDPPHLPWSAWIFRATALVATLAAALAGAVFLIGFALILIPVALGSALIAWAALRYRFWKVLRSANGK